MSLGRLVCLLAAALMLPGQVSERAARLHHSAFVFDGHVHMINRQFYHGGDIGARAPDGQVDLPRLAEGGVDALFFTLFVPEEYYPPRYETRQALRLLDLAREQIERNRNRIALAFNARDIERIRRQGRIAAVLDLEGAFDLDGDPAVLRSLYRLGLRSVQLPAHNWTSEFADSCCAPPKWGGLNERGRLLVREMNSLGMLINVSHASDQTIEQVLQLSTAPVLATHHGLRRFNDIPRTMPDHLLRKLASRGGVIGFHIGNAFHNRKFFEWSVKQQGRAFWDTAHVGGAHAGLSIEEIDRLVAPKFPMVGLPAPDELLMSVDQWLEVVEYAIAVAGEDHVALGSDFDGGPTPPRGIRDVRDLPLLTEAMLRRGWSERRIRKFLGENLLRVVRQVLETNP
jgi:membrane dipeptidase